MNSKFQIGDKVKFLNQVGGGVVTKIAGGFIYVCDDTGFDVPMPPNELIRMADMTGMARVFNQEVGGNAPSAEVLKAVAETEERVTREAESKAAAREAALARKLKEKFTAPDPELEQLREENKKLRSQVANLKDQLKKLELRLSQLQNRNARELNDNLLLQYQVRPGEAEVDLHIEALSEHPEQLSDVEKHELQLRFFRTCLNHAILNGFKKVVFIHGMGRGVLKTEIQRELDQYDNLQYMDAPMSKYGVGAVEVYFK